MLKNPASIYDVKENPLTGTDPGEITSDFVNKYLEKLINDFKSKIKATGKSVDEEHKKIQAELDKKRQEDAQAAEKRKQDALAKQQQQQATNNPTSVQTSYKADTPPVNPGEEGKPLASGQNSGPQTTTDNASKPLGGPLVANNKTFDGIKLSSQNVNIQGLNPELKERLGGLAAEYKQLTGESITINSAYRSPEEQKKLYEQNGGNSKLAAPPGSSLHEYGLAVDANSADLNKADKLGLLAKYGFTRPVGGETWHLEPTGVSAYPELAKRDPNKATELIESSAYKGGGGFALVGKKGSGRNTNMQLAIFNKDVDTSQLQKENPLSSPIEKTNQPPVAANQNSSPVDKANQTPVTAAQNKPQDTTAQTQTTKQSSQQTRSVVFKQSPVNVGEEGSKPSSSSTGIPVTQSNINTPPIKVMGNGNYSVQEAIKLAAQLTGMDEGLLNRIVQIESSGRANAKASTSSATGLFQFIDSTWQSMLKKYASVYNIPPDAKPDNPLYSAILGAQYSKDNLAYLKSKVGDFPVPEDTAIYLAHHYGPAGAVNILKFLKQNPSTPMQSAVDGKVYAANRGELGQKTVGEYMDYLNKKLGVGSVTMFSKTTGTGANAPKAAVQNTPSTAAASAPKVTAQATPSSATASAPNSSSASVNSTSQASAQPALRPSISGPAPSPLYKQQNDITPVTPKDAIVKIDTSTMEKLLQNQTTILEKIFTAVDSINQKYTPGGSQPSGSQSQSQGPINNNSNQKPSYGFKDISSVSINLGRMVNV
jgi:LAS superfamily LD-carboxypeptidase LdcB